MAFGCSDIGRMYYYMAQGNCLKFQQDSKQQFRGEILNIIQIKFGVHQWTKKRF